MTKSSSSQVQALDSNRNHLFNRLKQNFTEWLAVVIACVGVGVAMLAAFMSMLSYGQTWGMERELDEMREEIAVQRIYINNLHADLKARGFEPPEKEN